MDFNGILRFVLNRKDFHEVLIILIKLRNKKLIYYSERAYPFYGQKFYLMKNNIMMYKHFRPVLTL